MRLSPLLSRAAILTLAVASLSSSPASATDQLVLKQSKYSVTETLDRLTNILKSKGLTIFARIDHSAGAEKVGMVLRPTQVLIFGNPKMGTALMLANQKIGLALPMKALAFKDKDGKVWLSYRAPADLQNAYGLAAQGKLFAKMKGALGKLTDKATH